MAALKFAEQDNSAFCLENDDIRVALLAFLVASGEEFAGTAAELRPKIISTDPDLAAKLSVKKLGKRISALWPHLQKVLVTAKGSDKPTLADMFNRNLSGFSQTY